MEVDRASLRSISFGQTKRVSVTHDGLKDLLILTAGPSGIGMDWLEVDGLIEALTLLRKEVDNDSED